MSYCADEDAGYLAVADDSSGTSSHSYDRLDGSTRWHMATTTVAPGGLSRASEWDELATRQRATRGRIGVGDWLAWGRSTALTSYLVQLEGIGAGRDAQDLDSY